MMHYTKLNTYFFVYHNKKNLMGDDFAVIERYLEILEVKRKATAELKELTPTVISIFDGFNARGKNPQVVIHEETQGYGPPGKLRMYFKPQPPGLSERVIATNLTRFFDSHINIKNIESAVTGAIKPYGATSNLTFDDIMAISNSIRGVLVAPGGIHTGKIASKFIFDERKIAGSNMRKSAIRRQYTKTPPRI